MILGHYVDVPEDIYFTVYIYIFISTNIHIFQWAANDEMKLKWHDTQAMMTIYMYMFGLLEFNVSLSQ